MHDKSQKTDTIIIHTFGIHKMMFYQQDEQENVNTRSNLLENILIR